MRFLWAAALILLSATPSGAPGGLGGPGLNPWGQFGLPSCSNGQLLYNNRGQIGCEAAPQTSSVAQIKRQIANSFAYQVYSQSALSAGRTTYNSGTYTVTPGNPAPAFLQASQVYFVNFPSTNPGPANLKIIGGTKPIKIQTDQGTLLTLVGGEISAGPGILFYDGTEFIYTSFASPSNIPVTGSTAVSAESFSYRDTFYLTGGGETITLPCSTALSANDQIVVFSTNGTATIDVAASPCADNIIKNGNTSTSSQSVAQGAAAATVLTDGAGNFYVSGS